MLTTIDKVVAVSLLMVSWMSLCIQSEKHTNEQTVFENEVGFQHPVPLPDAVLQVLRRNKRSKFCLKQTPTVKEIPASWFEATEVGLGTNGATGFIVKNNDLCLAAADSGSFWVFRKLRDHYEMILNQSGGSLELLHSSSNGYYDISIGAATPAALYKEHYKFVSGKYRLVKRIVKPVSRSDAP